MPKGSKATTENSSITQPMKLSANLADIVGMKEAGPDECIKRLRAYLKANNLRDPENKQFFTPDKKLAKIFGNDRVEVFDMMKYIDNHLTKIDSKSDVNVFQAGPGTLCEPRIMELISNLLTITDDTTGGQFTTLTCRSIRIGSYKILTKEKVKKIVKIEQFCCLTISSIFSGIFYAKGHLYENSLFNGFGSLNHHRSSFGRHFED